MHHFNRWFARVAEQTARLAGSSVAFLGAVLAVALWAITGPIFHFSETWQLVINTGTTIVTFLMVFLIQNAQNRDMQALHVKLDAIIQAVDAADNTIIAIERQPVEHIQAQARRIVNAAQETPSDEPS